MKKVITSSHFKSPTIFVPIIDMFINYSGYGFFNGMLEPYMTSDKVNATAEEVGWAFFAAGAAYTITSVAAGLV